jgi:hypothetical protein
VLLIDIDIEAPSFYDIFRESIKKEQGIVDYLYDNLYNIDKNITLENIISKLNMNLKQEYISILYNPAVVKEILGMTENLKIENSHTSTEYKITQESNFILSNIWVKL